MSWLEESRPLDRPIFVVGCARSGTTVLSVPFFFHPATAPKVVAIGRSTLGEFSESLFDYERHLGFSDRLERKKLWYSFFRQKPVFADMGRELVVERAPEGRWRRRRLVRSLARLAGDGRLFLKAPTNSFRVLALAEIFPDAKFVAIHRDGRDVVASWGARPYGFARLGFDRGVDLFARKWNETIDYLLQVGEEIGLHHVRYERLLQMPQEVGARALEACELDPAAVPLDTWDLEPRPSRWRDEIPEDLHARLENLTALNRDRVSGLEG